MSGQTRKSGACTEPLLPYTEGTYPKSAVRVFSFFGDLVYVLLWFFFLENLADLFEENSELYLTQVLAIFGTIKLFDHPSLMKCFSDLQEDILVILVVTSCAS